MQIEKLLSSLTHVPTYFTFTNILCLLVMIAAFLLAVRLDASRETRKVVVLMIIMSVSLIVGIGLLFYSSNSINSAIKNAKITRVDDKIHIESKSEFLKSADLDIIAEKDGYIFVEHNDKTYRIEDLSKKGN